MGASEWTLVAVTVFTAIFGLIGGLLNRQIKQSDKEREEDLDRTNQQIALLFKKHDDDAAALQSLREMVIGEHYRRDELDARFKELGDTFRDGFREVGSKLDDLSKAMTNHIGEHTGVYRSREAKT